VGNGGWRRQSASALSSWTAAKNTSGSDTARPFGPRKAFCQSFGAGGQPGRRGSRAGQGVLLIRTRYSDGFLSGSSASPHAVATRQRSSYPDGRTRSSRRARRFARLRGPHGLCFLRPLGGVIELTVGGCRPPPAQGCSGAGVAFIVGCVGSRGLAFEPGTAVRAGAQVF